MKVQNKIIIPTLLTLSILSFASFAAAEEVAETTEDSAGMTAPQLHQENIDRMRENHQERVETTQEKMADRQEQQEDRVEAFQENTEARQEEMELRKEDREATMEEKAAERKTEMTERRNEMVRKHSERMTTRLHAAVERMAGLKARVESRIEKLEQLDTSAALGILEDFDTTTINNSIDSLAESIEAALASEDPKAAYATIKGETKLIVEDIKALHAVIVEAITTLKAQAATQKEENADTEDAEETEVSDDTEEEHDTEEVE